MSQQNDPLAQRRNKGADRVHYAEGIMLDAGDFQTEQLYHRGQLARSLKYLFGTGTVAGLMVSHKAVFDDQQNLVREEIEVSPGLAIDPVGRLVEVPRLACIRLDRWWKAALEDDEGVLRAAIKQGVQGDFEVLFDGSAPATLADGVVVDVFLRYAACPHAQQFAFARGAGDATNHAVPHRIRDGYELHLVLRDETSLPRPNDDDLADFAQGANTAALRRRVLNGWREDTEDWRTQQPSGPRHLVEHPENTDGRDILLARVVIEANAANTPLVRIGQRVHIDNMIRRFIHAPGVLSWDPA